MDLSSIEQMTTLSFGTDFSTPSYDYQATEGEPSNQVCSRHIPQHLTTNPYYDSYGSFLNSHSAYLPTVSPSRLPTIVPPAELMALETPTPALPMNYPETLALNIYPQGQASLLIRCCNCGHLQEGPSISSTRGSHLEMEGATGGSTPPPTKPLLQLETTTSDITEGHVPISNPMHVPSTHHKSLLLGQIIPQRPYKSHGRANRVAGGIRNVVFSMEDGGGFPLKHALGRKYTGLVQRDKVFNPPSLTVYIRVEWPGYPSWSRQIKITDGHNPPRPITQAKLGTEIARSLKSFINEMKDKRIDKDEEQWRVGPTGININRLVLNSLHRESKSSWQAVLSLSS